MNNAASEIISTKVGQPVEIELKFPGASGYEWSVSFDGTCVSLLGRQRKLNSKKMGAKAKEVFKFEALAKGDHKISFALRRPWEDEAVEHRYIVLHVEESEPEK
jgi:predicted secreted protein